MEKELTTQRLPDNKIYYPRFRKLYLFLGVFNIVLSVVVFVVTNTLTRVLVPSLIGALLLYIGLSLRIEISSKGIAYYNILNYHIFSAWHNIAGVEKVKFRFVDEVRCLTLLRPASKAWTASAIAVPRERRSLLIPLDKNWQDIQQLKKDILNHAPHIKKL